MAIGMEDIAEKVDERMKRENIGEVLSRNTVDDGHGHFVTTVVWRTPKRDFEEADGTVRVWRETRYQVFVDGEAQSGGGCDAEFLQ